MDTEKVELEDMALNFDSENTQNIQDDDDEEFEREDANDSLLGFQSRENEGKRSRATEQQLMTSRQSCWLAFGVTTAVVVILLVACYLAYFVHPTSSSKDQLAGTPPMGWNSWNKFQCEGLNEDLVKTMADALVSTGLAKAGYIYVNLDDCWQIDRDADGVIQPDTSEARFKNGIKPLADYVHSKGLKFGLYTDMGTLTCQRRPGSNGHERKDVETYAAWGVDFIKNDDCYVYPTLNIFQDYQRMWESVLATGRPMIHSVKGVTRIETAHLVSHMRRVGWDINPTWDSFLSLVDLVVETDLWQYAKPGFWNDLDMLEVGNEGLSENENVAHMALWCAFKAPLLLGNDIRNMSTFIRELLVHDELLSVLKDPLGKSVQRVYLGNAQNGSAKHQVVTKPCNPKDPRQIWHYDEQKGSLINQHTLKCLTVGWQNYLYLGDCDPDAKTQQWKIDFSTRQIRQGEHLCWNTQPVLSGGSRLTDCYERQGPEDFSKHNGAWMAYNDVFRMELVDENAFVLSNSARLCPTFGGPPELQIFAGPLADERYVAILLNRDNKANTMSLMWEYLPGIAGVHQEYQVRDIYKRTELGVFRGVLKATVEAHSVLIVKLSPAERN